MPAYLARRLLSLVPVLWAAATLTFFALRLTPGDPADALFAEAQLSPERRQANRAALGLDQSLGRQYLLFMRAILRGDLGVSYFTGRPVTTTLAELLAPTAGLAAAGLVTAAGLGLLLGGVAAYAPWRTLRGLADGLTALSLATPVAWSGLLALGALAWWAGPQVAPAIRPFLPAAVLGFALAGPIAGVARGALAGVRREPYLVAARARGVSGARLAWHVLRTALVPVVHLPALQAAFLFGGAVVTETVFARPGLGRLLVDSLLQRDFPVVQGLVLLVAALYLTFNFLADLLSALLDPRIRPSLE